MTKGSGRSARAVCALGLAALLGLPLAGCKGDGEAEAAAGETTPALAVSHVRAAVHPVEATEPAMAALHAARAPQLGAEVDGALVRLVAEEGAEVRRNDLLAIIDDGEHKLAHQRAEAEMRRIDVKIDEYGTELDRLERMHEGGNASQAALDAARARVAEAEQERVIAETDFLLAERALARTRVVSPHDGLIAARHASEGDYVTAGTVLFDLTDHSRLQVRVPLPETLADRVAEGQELRLWRDDEGVAPRMVAIDRISPNIDDASRAVTAIAHIEDAPQDWRPGGTLRAELVLERRNAILLPPEAVVRRPAGQVVYVLEGTSVRALPVEIGLRGHDWLEIRSGLRPGMDVVVDGAGFLSDGAEVEARPRVWSPPVMGG